MLRRLRNVVCGWIYRLTGYDCRDLPRGTYTYPERRKR